MSSGLPSALPLTTVSRNFSGAVHVVAATCLIGAVVVTLAFQAYFPTLMLWPAIVGLFPIAIALFLSDRFNTIAFSLLYLAAGATSVYAFALVFESGVAQGVLSRAVTVELPKIALVMVGSTGAGSLSSLRWSIAGFVTAELAASAVRLELGMPLRFDWITTGAFATVALVLVFAYLNRRRASRTRRQFTSAAQEELIAALRYRIEARAAAVLHDTVLSHLAAIATTASSSLPPALTAQMERDLDTLTASEWLDRPPPIRRETEWRSNPLNAAVREANALGLEVGVTGETSAVARLDADRANELALAVKQCLVNVLRHSGTTDAELVVYGAEDELLVMVVDTGAGFDTRESPSDRLGIRQSIVGRIENVGGSVQIWSTPGRGTSIVIRLPIVGEHEDQPAHGVTT